MSRRSAILLGGLALTALQPVLAQSSNLVVPKAIEAGSAFSIQCLGSGNATLYIAGPGEVLKRDLQLGGTTSFAAGSLYNAGHYVVVVVGNFPTEMGSLDVVPAGKPANLSFLAKPSRLPVGLHDGITGAVYVFDAYRNLVTAPMPVSFELKNPSGAAQVRTVATRDGAAWTAMDSTAQQGIDKFSARIEDISSVRAVGQVPGNPCTLRMSARPLGAQVQLQTDPVRDCSGNAVPDGTIVTFTANYNGAQSTVDVPLKHGIAEAKMPAHEGATISVASGVAMGNQIRWGK